MAGGIALFVFIVLVGGIAQFLYNRKHEATIREAEKDLDEASERCKKALQ